MPTMVPVKRSGRYGVRTWGRLTARLRVLPNVIIAGAQRSGTTSMHRWLAAHPGAITPVRHKGVHFFDVNYTRGMDWYRGHFPTQQHVQRVGESLGYSPVIFETTPYYMFHPTAPNHIAEQIPDVRIVVILRDPVVRAYSAWSHERARGFETLDFREALAAEPGRLAHEEERLRADPGYVSHAHRHNAYAHRGRYVDQLIRLERAFGRQQILVVDYGLLTTDASSVQSELLEFVELPKHPLGQLKQFNSRERHPLEPDVEEGLRETLCESDIRLEQWLGWRPTWMEK